MPSKQLSTNIFDIISKLPAMKVNTNYYFVISEICRNTENGKYLSTFPTIKNSKFEMTKIHKGRSRAIIKFYGLLNFFFFNLSEVYNLL